MTARMERKKRGTACFRWCVGVGALALAALASACGSSSTRPIAAPKGLWAPNFRSPTTAGNVVEFLAKQLKTSGSPIPQLTNSSSAIDMPFTVLLDKSGNQWVINAGTPAVTEFSKSQLQGLSTTPAPTPVVTLTSTSFVFIIGGVFDSSRNLWVGDGAAGSLFEFTPTQLAAGGGQTPNITLTSTDLTNAQELRFATDGSGNLWIANGTDATVLEFSKSQLAAGGSQSANIVLSGVNTTFTRPRGLIFDKSGNLWVTDVANDTVLKFKASDITAAGDPTPAVILSSATVAGATGSTSSLDKPTGIAFDSAGSLWVSNLSSDTNGSLSKFTSAQRGSSGSPAPAVFIDDDGTGNILDAPEFIIFGPAVTT